VVTYVGWPTTYICVAGHALEKKIEYIQSLIRTNVKVIFMNNIILILILALPVSLIAQTNTFPTSGNVGIGTLSPNSKLHIADGAGGEQLRFSRGSGAVRFVQDVNQDDLYLVNSDASKTLMFWGSNGHVGLGTYYPGSKLHIADGNGGEQLTISRGTGAVRFVQDINQNNLYLYNKDASLMYMFWKANGNIGIGTINPDYKLTVDGGLKSYYNVSGDNIESITSRVLSSQIEGLRITTSSSNTNKAVFGVVGFATSSYNLPGSATATGVYGQATSPSGSYAGFFNGNLGYSGSFGNPSDRRLKENINELPNSLDLILKLKPVQFLYKKIDGINLPDGQRAGFIAQDIEALIPSLVNHNGIPLPNLLNDSTNIENKSEKYLTDDYIGLTPYIIKSIQDQQLILDKQNLLIESMLAKDSVNSISNLASNHVPHIIKLFPNPAQNQLNIECYTNDQPSNIVVYNKDGKIYRSLPVSGSMLNISLESFEDGLYLLALNVNGITFDIKRFIVSK